MARSAPGLPGIEPAEKPTLNMEGLPTRITARHEAILRKLMDRDAVRGVEFTRERHLDLEREAARLDASGLPLGVIVAKIDVEIRLTVLRTLRAAGVRVRFSERASLRSTHLQHVAPSLGRRRSAARRRRVVCGARRRRSAGTRDDGGSDQSDEADGDADAPGGGWAA